MWIRNEFLNQNFVTLHSCSNSISTPMIFGLGIRKDGFPYLTKSEKVYYPDTGRMGSSKRSTIPAAGKKYPKSYINVEKVIKINGLVKRYDVVVFQPNGKLFLLVECKSTDIVINQTTFDQIARYNMVLESEYLMVTNGLNHYFCQMDYQNEKYNFLKELPAFN